MMLMDRVVATFTHILNILTLSTFSHDNGNQQRPIFLESESSRNAFTPKGPVFTPPGGGFDSNFKCNYTAMKGWEDCSTPTNRFCWLKHSNGSQYNIDTDYEQDAPEGILRQYWLNVGYGSINADGQIFPGAQLFNNSYPGPWIQACWGDTVEITVTVQKDFHNGTAVHWHGIRQNQTAHMDGVAGITQCPIPPGESFTYRWKATQYGSSWYHSHYSVQYADGLLGPLTIHGPSTANFDEAGKEPLLITDYDHASAFQTIHNSLLSSNPTILLNGKGNVTKCNPQIKSETIPHPTTIRLERGKSYLLRVINTAFDSTFLFSIDHHEFTIVSADFVPISPHPTRQLHVGIGQRYNVIVKANPIAEYGYPLPIDENFWIRAHVIDDCFGSAPEGEDYHAIGILTYDADKPATPNSLPWPELDTKTCKGEEGWKPWFPWIIEQQDAPSEEHDVQFVPPGTARSYPLAKFAIATQVAALSPTPTPVRMVPMRVNYQNITFLNLDNTGGWPDDWVVVSKDRTSSEWVYLAISGDFRAGGTGAHPMHLHGHDFAVLAQVQGQEYNPRNVTLNTQNPPRRDVVMLPQAGYVVIAFKADNPGPWLMHCHIAKHASFGLSLQIMEDREKANALWKKGDSAAIDNAAALCNKWDDWYSNCTNHWNGTCDKWFQDDSGI